MKPRVKHFILCAALFLIAAVLEYAAYLHDDSLRANPLILNDDMAVAPVYNRDGSWLHGLWRIDYNGISQIFVLERGWRGCCCG